MCVLLGVLRVFYMAMANSRQTTCIQFNILFKTDLITYIPLATDYGNVTRKVATALTVTLNVPAISDILGATKNERFSKKIN